MVIVSFIKSLDFSNLTTETLRDGNADTILIAWTTKIKELIAISTAFSFYIVAFGTASYLTKEDVNI